MTAEWWGVVISGLVGAGGLITALVSNRRASAAGIAANKANDLAAEANRHAADAVAVAKEANRVAEAANELAEDSNTITRLEADKHTEHWLTEFTAEWKPEICAVILTNVGRDAAIEPTVILNGVELRDAWVGKQSYAREEKIRLEYPHIADRRNELNAENAKTVRDLAAAGIIFGLRKWSEKVPVIITWKTGLGQHREQRLDLKIE